MRSYDVVGYQLDCDTAVCPLDAPDDIEELCEADRAFAIFPTDEADSPMSATSAKWYSASSRAASITASMGWTGCSPRQEWSDARRRCEDTVTALDDFRRAKKETTDGG